MLIKIKDNIRNNVRREETITGLTILDDTMLISKTHHNLNLGDVVHFKRTYRNTLVFEEDKEVQKIIDQNTFKIDGFGEWFFHPQSYTLEKLLNPITLEYEEFIKFSFNEENGHIFFKNRSDIGNTHRYYDENGEYVINDQNRICVGDYAAMDNTYLMRIESGNTFSGPYNINDVEFRITYNDTEYTLSGGIVPIGFAFDDNRTEILFPYSGTNLDYLEIIDGGFNTSNFRCDDVRFLRSEDSVSFKGLNFQDNAFITKIIGDIEIEVGIGENMGMDLMQEAIYNADYQSIISKNIVDPIINFEKYPYEPMYYTGPYISGQTDSTTGEVVRINDNIDEYLDKNISTLDTYLAQVDTINFNLNFRERAVVSVDSETALPDYGGWKIVDDGFWNNYKLSSDGTHLEYRYPEITGNTADMLGFLGYTDDDIFYQKNCIKKSFLRLSFYDSTDRTSQNLLFYSTVYFDTAKLQDILCRDRRLWSKDMNYIPPFGYYSLSYAYNIKQVLGLYSGLLDARLSCSNRYDTTSSADGFYLHLFEGMVKGNMNTPIYMKVEFNNAKFGVTVPFIYPTDKETNQPISPLSPDFPLTYELKTSSTGDNIVGIDMDRLINDMYIKVFLRYDKLTKSFVWFFPRETTGVTNPQNITLNLFEPKLYGIEPNEDEEETEFQPIM